MNADMLSMKENLELDARKNSRGFAAVVIH